MIYRVFEEWPDQEWEEKVNISLFSRSAYWELQVTEAKKTLSVIPLLVKNELGDIVSFWCFSLDGKSWKTPFNAPFFEPYMKKNVAFSKIFLLITQYLKEKQDLPITYKFPPQYSPLKDKHKDILKIARISSIAVGHVLLVDATKSFSELIFQKRKRRKLKSLLAGNFQVKEAKTREWPNLYEQLLSWREFKAHQNLIPKELMLKSKDVFPHHYRCLHLILKGETVGLVFFVQSNTHSFYIYSLITDPQLDKQQPSLVLWNALYQTAKKEQIDQLDLGTSMLENGKINKGLFHFKLALGAIPTKKLTLSC